MGLIVHRRKRKKKVILLVFLLVIVGLAIWQESMETLEEECFPAVGTMFEVNGHQVHAYVKGTSDQAMVFLTGSGTPCAYTDYYVLQSRFSKVCETITFERPGFSWSEATDISGEVDEQVEELKLLLNQAVKAKSYVIVAHSLASLEAIRFAQRYPELVKGIVFLDCGSPEYYQENGETQAIVINRANALLRVSGWNRLLSGLTKLPIYGEDLRYAGLPDEVKKLDLVLYEKYLGNGKNLPVIEHMNENAELIVENKQKMDIPFLVISSDESKEWTESQMQLLDWSSDAKQVVLKDSKHYIHWSNQEEVIKLIKTFITKGNGENK